MQVIRTPAERFVGLSDYDFAPHHVEIDGLRMHYIESGPASAAPILLLHGEPSWSYLYRKMIPPLAGAGHRVIAPDLIGFGKSDKPTRIRDYSYARHVSWMTGFIETLGLTGITLFGQSAMAPCLPVTSSCRRHSAPGARSLAGAPGSRPAAS
jgi:haloalkane dehalogenase